MTTKAKISSRLPVRRGFSAPEAAVYLSLSPSFFLQLVVENLMPRPRIAGGRRIWDIEELDLAFKELPREARDPDDPMTNQRTNTWADYE